MSRSKRVALVAGLTLLVIFVIVLMIWLFRTPYDVLFSAADTQDQGAIVNELERLKIPYRISDDGASILVEKDLVNRTRLKVMSQGVDLKGTVGFEIFNEADFGASEFAQKINYQRALQGELARTITSIDEVKSARVHLVLPESGLLKRKDASAPKASVALTIKNDGHLSAEQIAGIQRLVAAAVPDLEAQAVVVSDQQGVTLSKSAQLGSDVDGVSNKLEMKQQAEQYLTRKVADLLDKALGPGQAIVSVDVTLNYDQINSSREDINDAPGPDGQPLGALVRKRQSIAGNQNVAKEKDDAATPAPRAGTETLEVEYTHGKKEEQIIGSPGGIKRLSVGVFVPPSLDDSRIQKIRDIITMAVGFNAQRGDGISVQSIASASTPPQTESSLKMVPEVAVAAPSHPGTPVNPDKVIGDAFLYALIVIALLALLVWALVSRNRLSAVERERLVRELRSWLDKDSQSPSPVEP